MLKKLSNGRYEVDQGELIALEFSSNIEAKYLVVLNGKTSPPQQSLSAGFAFIAEKPSSELVFRASFYKSSPSEKVRVKIRGSAGEIFEEKIEPNKSYIFKFETRTGGPR